MIRYILHTARSLMRGEIALMPLLSVAIAEI